MAGDLTVFVGTDFLAIAGADGGHRLHASRRLAAGHRLFHLNGVVVDSPSKFSIQIGLGQHVEVPADTTRDEQLQSFPWRFLNHSCDPNLVIRNRQVMTRRSIEATEELTFNYNTTEYDMATPFMCRCGAPECSGVIGGFRYLAISEQERLEPILSDYLRTKVEGYRRATA